VAKAAYELVETLRDKKDAVILGCGGYESGWTKLTNVEGGAMAKGSTKRVSASSIKIDTNVRCQRIYPVEDKKHAEKKIAELKTVGIKLSRAQAIHLARVLLAASQEWEEMDITAWRVYKRQTDNTYNITVTSAIKE
jgi:hypothetical protein